MGVIILYAIAFDLDTDTLKKTYPSGSWNNACNDIKQALAEHGFSRQQGSVYFGDMKNVNAVTCVIAAQDLTRAFPWFAASVRDIRMLRIEDDNDLKPAIEKMPAATRG
ncbi:endoribonuclease VapD [Synergistales bacterium]|nr:endoribonuclease VapD [Synergistales bacterium]GHV55443.1 endoribonuclease VapD [Synergistales bacterium]